MLPPVSIDGNAGRTVCTGADGVLSGLEDAAAVDDDQFVHRPEFLVYGGDLVPVGDDDGAVLLAGLDD
ncbi:hypothetical protein C496_19410 [Natronorubrum tibetense GA33]|uniref:Uncharacterized protein n=1 Tax=Natronorubrum tibetense GA33 TaxID=1114856 RepID=L9VN79_9EURY|nr:hypothetical protein C496_19410 [Natronorubrum tibetense GA33]